LERDHNVGDFDACCVRNHLCGSKLRQFNRIESSICNQKMAGELLPSIRDPFGVRTAPRGGGPQEGDTRQGGRLTYRNGQWVETNVIQEGQRSTLGGKTVVADGQGNWERIEYMPDGSFKRTKVGTYQQGPRYGAAVELPGINAPSPTSLVTKTTPTEQPSPPTQENRISVTGADGIELSLDMSNPADVQKLQQLKAKRNPDAKRQTGNGLNTDTGLIEPAPSTPENKSFQDLQQQLMKDIAGKYSDPRTAALIRGVPQNPFSSTQLPYTSDNFFTNAEDFDLGIDTSGMLERSKDIDYEKLAKSVTEGSQTFPLEAGNFIEDYESPVNFNAPKNPVEPMLNPAIGSSMDAMRMKDRDLGLMYASGQFFAEGKDGDPVLVNRELAKDVRRGKEGAADQLAAYLAGGGIKPQGGVIYNPDKEDMVPTNAQSLVDPSFNSEDAQVMGVPAENAEAMTSGKGSFYDSDENIDDEDYLAPIIGGLTNPFSKYLSY